MDFGKGLQATSNQLIAVLLFTDSLTTFGIRSKKSMNGCISKFTMDGKDYTSRIVPVGLASYGCENINP